MKTDTKIQILDLSPELKCPIMSLKLFIWIHYYYLMVTYPSSTSSFALESFPSKGTDLSMPLPLNECVSADCCRSHC